MISIEEEKNIRKILKEENFFGTPLPDKVNARRSVAKLNLDLALEDKYKNITGITVDIANILNNYHSYALETTFNTYDLERQIEDLSYVRYARVSHVINDRIPSSNYQVGYIIQQDDSYYMAEKILGLSGTTEPVWSIPITIAEQNFKDIDPMRTYIDTDGNEKSEYYLTTDGSLVWKCYKRLPNIKDISEWQPNYNYGLNEYVYTNSQPKYMFKCVDIKKTSGLNIPNISNAKLKDFIIDGSLVWVVKDYTDAPQWSSFTQYSIGDSVNVSNSALYSLECVSYTGTIESTNEIEFSKEKYKIVSKDPTAFYVSGDVTKFFKAGDTISAEYSKGYINYSVSNASYISTSNLTQITVTQMIDVTKSFQNLITVQRGTRDGQILWEIVEDINNIKYNWDTYATYDYSLNIIRG